MDDLPLEVGLVDDVRVDDAECPDAGSGEVERRGRAETARTNEQDTRIEEALLPSSPTSGINRCRL
jgi:hypothetical protein